MKVYYLGVVTTFLAIAGMAEAITGRGNYSAAAIWLIIGLIMALTGYMK